MLAHYAGDTDLIYSDQATSAAIIKAGGLPLYAPANKENLKNIKPYLDKASGIVITGEDAMVSPQYYGENTIYVGQRIDDQRDRFDTELVRAAHEQRLPILAICKGMQLVNVALGGSLYQNITVQHPQAIEHDAERDDRSDFSHDANIISGSILKSIFGGRMRTNGGHQQAVERLATGLTAVAVASDGIVEAYEEDGYPFLLGVQFHPELRPDDKQYSSIFDKFIASTMTNEQ